MRVPATARAFARSLPSSRQAKTVDFVLPSPPQSGRQVGLVLIPGFQIGSGAYAPVLAAAQKAAESRGLSLFAGCAQLDWPSHPLQHPGDLRDRIEAVVQAMRRRGLRAEDPVFHAAHSLSTTFLQDYLLKTGNSAGQVLLGGSLLRKHCYPAFTYNVPTLTVHAELDGEEHIMRQAEQYSIHRCLDPTRFPLVVLPGQTHMQFASGSRPAHFKQELPPAVKEHVAHEAIGEVVIDFMRMQLGEHGAGVALEAQTRSTQALLLPMLLSMQHAAAAASSPQMEAMLGM